MKALECGTFPDMIPSSATASKGFLLQSVVRVAVYEYQLLV